MNISLCLLSWLYRIPWYIDKMLGIYIMCTLLDEDEINSKYIYVYLYTHTHQKKNMPCYANMQSDPFSKYLL